MLFIRNVSARSLPALPFNLILAITFTVLLFLALHATARAAEFRYVGAVDNVPQCEMTGLIEEGDEDKFSRLYAEHFSCRLSLDSPGGNYGTALKIIEQMESYTPTIVQSGRRCLSACALIFMAGMGNEDAAYANRVMEPGATIGFHRPYLDLGEDDGRRYSSREIERAFSGSIDVINRLIKRSNTRFWNGDSSAQSYYFPPILLTKMLEKRKDEFFELETVGDLLISGVFLKSSIEQALDAYPSEKFRNVCDNYYWQSIDNFTYYDESKGKFDPIPFFDDKFEEYAGKKPHALETVKGEEYHVYRDYPAPEGTYRECLVRQTDYGFTAAFRYYDDNFEFENLRSIFAYPRHAPIAVVALK